MAVSTQHQQYIKALTLWRQVNDFIDGKAAINARRKTYLPKEEAWSDSQYDNYVELAPYTNFTLRTLQTLLGALFYKPPVIELPAQLEYLKYDCDGKGNGLDALAQKIGAAVIANGRCGVLIDFPRNELEREDATADVTAGLSAISCFYSAFDIDGWSVEHEYIKMKEVVSDPEADIFNPKQIEQYRVLRLIDGVYTVEIYREGDLWDSFEPRDFNGFKLNYIPLVIFGSVNNDLDVDYAPLYEISEKSKTHLQCSADVMRSVRMQGTPTPHIDYGQMSWSEFCQSNNINETSPVIKFGSGGGVFTKLGGKLTMVQANPNTMAATERDVARDEAIMIGARLVLKGSGQITATQAFIDSGAEQSVLSTIRGNLNQGMSSLIEFFMSFMLRAPTDYSFEMSSEFFTMQPDAQVLTVAMQLGDRGYLAHKDIHHILKSVGLMRNDRTIEQIIDEVGDLTPIE